MLPGQILCVGCGFNTANAIGAGLASAGDAAPPKSLRCRECGYDLRGLRGAGKCPECGTAIRLYDKRGFLDEQMRAELRRSYIFTLGVTIVALAGVCGLGYFNEGWAGSLKAITVFGFQYAATIVLVFACGLMWIGFEAPHSLTLSRLAMACVLVRAIGFGLALVPFFCLNPFGIPIVPVVLSTVVFALIMWEICEMDFNDASIVALLVTSSNIAVRFFVETMLF